MEEGEAALVGIVGSAGVGARLARHADGAVKTESVATPYGSVDLTRGTIGGAPFAAGEKSAAAPFPPHRIPYRAPFFALRRTGVTRVLSTSVGTSFEERLFVGHCLVPDDFLDFSGRALTFFDGGLDGTHHAEMARPFCERLSKEFVSSARSFGLRAQHGGTVATVAGPQHPSDAEAAYLASRGAAASSFSAATEAKLARELGQCLVAPVIIVRQAAGQPGWKGPRARESAELSDEELLRTFARGEEAPLPVAGVKPRRTSARPRRKAERELEEMRALLRDVDGRVEEAAAGFVASASALPACPHCSAGAGPAVW